MFEIDERGTYPAPEIACPAECGRVSEYGGLCDACVVVSEVRAIGARRPIRVRGVLVAALAFGALALGACAADEPTAEERAVVTEIRETFAERPPVPGGVRVAPDWAEYVADGAVGTLPPRLCDGRSPSDVDARIVLDSPIPSVGGRLEQRWESADGSDLPVSARAGDGRPVRSAQTYWVDGSGRTVAAYVRINRDFFAYGQRVAVYAWCDR